MLIFGPGVQTEIAFQVAVPSFDQVGPFRIVVQSFAQLPDAALQDVVGDSGVGSNPTEELIACDDGTVRIDQAKKDFRGFGFHMNTTIAPLDAVTLCSGRAIREFGSDQAQEEHSISLRQHTPDQFRRVRLLLPVGEDARKCR